MTKNSDSFQERTKRKMMYDVYDAPPWRLSILLGIQHYFTQFGSSMMVPLLMANAVCAGDNASVKHQLISSSMMVCGIATFLQGVVGVRLPMMLGANFVYATQAFNMVSLPEWQCASTVVNDTNGTMVTVPDARHAERLQEIMGAVMIASSVQIFSGLFGLVGFVASRIGPLVFTTVIVSLGLAIVSPAVAMASKCWPIAILTMVLATVFWMYLEKVQVPLVSFSCGRKNCSVSIVRFPLFSSFPIFLALLLGWLLCYLLTVTNVFSSSPGGFGYGARTDWGKAEGDIPWISVPLPFPWGMPTVTSTVAVGMAIGIVATITDSVSDYFATSRVAGASIPPKSAVNRGVFIEGLMTLLAGVLGAGAGTATYTENVAIVAITKVGSARVSQMAGLVSILLAIFGKFAAFFATIPDPVIGGLMLILFGVITGLGMQNLQFVDLKSLRNLFVVGVSVLFSYAAMHYINSKPQEISTGSKLVDQLIQTVFGNNVVTSIVLSLFLDSTLPGTDEERGLLSWRSDMLGQDESDNLAAAESESESDPCHTHKRSSYDLPLIMPFLERHKIFSRIPISPTYKKQDKHRTLADCNLRNDQTSTTMITNEV